MEQRIVRAVRWMGEARHTGNLEDAFVKNSIAMEALLLSPGGRLDDPKAAIGSITSQLAERAGFLLGRERDERATIVRKIRRLYGVRSGIVHGSQKVEHDDLTRWEIYVVQCLEAVLILEFRRIEDLVEWVDHVKYSGEPKSGRPLWHLLYGECDGERPAIWEGGGAIS